MENHNRCSQMFLHHLPRETTYAYPGQIAIVETLWRTYPAQPIPNILESLLTDNSTSRNI